MTNSGKLKIIIVILFCFMIILAGMLIYVIQEKLSAKEDSTAGLNSGQAMDSANLEDSSKIDEKLDLNLYLFDADDYDRPKDVKTVAVDKKLYQEDMTAAVNELLQGTGLKLNKVEAEDNSIVVDLPREVAAKFNEGSAGGITLTNILVMTLLNLPEIEEMKVTVDGSAGIEGDHYNFKGTFYKTQNGYRLG